MWPAPDITWSAYRSPSGNVESRSPWMRISSVRPSGLDRHRSAADVAQRNQLPCTPRNFLALTVDMVEPVLGHAWATAPIALNKARSPRWGKLARNRWVGRNSADELIDETTKHKRDPQYLATSCATMPPNETPTKSLEESIPTWFTSLWA